MSRVYLLIVVLALATVSGCDRSVDSSPVGAGAPAAGTPTAPWLGPPVQSPDLIALAPSMTPTEAAAAVRTWRIMGARPFPTLGDYLTWLGTRPGTAGTALEPIHIDAQSWDIGLRVNADDGRMERSTCNFPDVTAVERDGLRWFDCPGWAALWTSFTPPSIPPTREDINHFYPLAVVLLVQPQTLLPDFTWQSAHLPDGVRLSPLNLFVLETRFVDSLGTVVSLFQQGGAGIGIFELFTRCETRSFPWPGQCLAWLSPAGPLLLYSETAPMAVLRRFQAAIIFP